jgi:hypothetical protein
LVPCHSEKEFPKCAPFFAHSNLAEDWFVLDLIVRFERWQAVLRRGVNLIELFKATGDPRHLVALDDDAPRSPSDLVERVMYELSPEWLQVLMMCGAQHFYYAAGTFHPLSKTDGTDDSHWWCDQALDRCRTSQHYLAELLNEIKNLVPDAYLHCPASISDEAFLTER